MSGRPIDENDCIICGKECVSLFFCEECEEEKQWEEKCDTLERQLAEAREEALKYKIKYNNQSSDILRLRQSKKDQTELIRKLKGKGDE